MGTTIFLVVIAIAIWRFISSRQLAQLLEESEVVTPHPTVTNERIKEYSQNREMMCNEKVEYQAYQQPKPKMVQQQKRYQSSLNSSEVKKENEIITDFDPTKAIIYSEIMRPKYF